MKTPAWVWDWKQKKYLRLPPGLIRFDDGNWGFRRNPYPEGEWLDFHREHYYLFRYEPDTPYVFWERIILRKQPGPKKYQPNKDKARITKVQR